MSIGKITSLIVILMTAVATVAASPAEAPRKSPPLKITKASGKEMQLLPEGQGCGRRIPVRAKPALPASR
jgi:hypothetical protein